MLTVLHEKLGEAHGLAIAATTLTEKVGARVLDSALRGELATLRLEAEETRARCLQVEHAIGEPLSSEILAHAQSTKEKAADLVGAWFKAGTDPLRAWSFLAMGEAAEVAVWAMLAELAPRAELDGVVAELADWALPVQRRHLEVVLGGAVRLAARSDPDGPRWG